MSVGTQLIDRVRQEFVTKKARLLFDRIVQHVVPMNPTEQYFANVAWTAEDGVINDLVLKKTVDLFKEIGSELKITQLDSEYVRIILRPETSPTESEVVSFYWSRRPGKFINKLTGKEYTFAPSNLAQSAPPTFTGTVREWYETLIETIIDCANSMEKVTNQVPTSVYVGRDVRCILECSVLFKPNFRGSEVFTAAVGTISNRFNVFEDTTLSDTIRLVEAKDEQRYVGTIKVLDMNII